MLDEITQPGKTEQMAGDSAQPYRRYLIGLPLQQSLFRLAAHAATTIALPGLSSELNFPARLDENGDLFLDRSQVTALSRALPATFTPETLDAMGRTHADACDALVRAGEEAARAATFASGEVGRRMEDFANRMALVLAYGVLSKFVPDVLLRALADAGETEPPPFPEKSAGAMLMQDTLALYQACCDLGYGPERLQREWPEVPPEISRLITRFSEQQTGFGPLAWDSPGYEDPGYVVRLLHSAFGQVDAEQLSRRFATTTKPIMITPPTGEVSPKIAALRRLLAFWLEFLERETWYVRRAFYVGLIPLLRKTAATYRQKITNFRPVDLLFLEIRELHAGTIDPSVIQARRERYMANTSYLSLHGVSPTRLDAILGGS
jgi:hypothetical protein